MNRAEAQETSSALATSLGIGFDHAPVALLVVDIEGRVLAANRAAASGDGAQPRPAEEQEDASVAGQEVASP